MLCPLSHTSSPWIYFSLPLKKIFGNGVSQCRVSWTETHYESFTCLKVPSIPLPQPQRMSHQFSCFRKQLVDFVLKSWAPPCRFFCLCKFSPWHKVTVEMWAGNPVLLKETPAAFFLTSLREGFWEQLWWWRRHQGPFKELFCSKCIFQEANRLPYYSGEARKPFALKFAYLCIHAYMLICMHLCVPCHMLVCIY